MTREELAAYNKAIEPQWWEHTNGMNYAIEHWYETDRKRWRLVAHWIGVVFAEITKEELDKL